tara:strand:- start:10245 stop:12194 length:1950 start_codon:yes stop_codon:yes gene_type:complete
MKKLPSISLIHASQIKIILFLVGSLTLAIFVYSSGWSGGWHFDDAPNLNNLVIVFSNGQFDWDAAQNFVFSGDAGPLGRPVSLAVFLVDGGSWPSSPDAMLYTNTLLHVINSLLLCGLWLAVFRQRGQQATQSTCIALAAGVLWLIQPILASGVLMVVQRMVLLSSGFMLLGAWLYVLGRYYLETRPVLGWALVLGGLGGGTLLGVFSKEQAALLPLLLWVLDACLLRESNLSGIQRQSWRVFKIFAFYLPAIVISIYLLRVALNADSAYGNREFTLSERLWTQSVILWDYLRLGFLPRTLDFSPFHDDFPVLGVSFTTILAVAAWLAIFVAFWMLRYKSRWPLFALLWFWVSHLVESTVIPLELYFEHRNYLAIAGPLFALVALTAQWSKSNGFRQRIVISSFCVYGFLLLFVLSQVVTLYGHKSIAAELWHDQHPQSIRAAQYLAGNLSDHGDVMGALEVLDDTALRHPGSGGALNLQGLQLACVLNANEDELQARLDKVLVGLRQGTKRFSINDPLDKLKIIMENGGCSNFLNNEMLIHIASVALRNVRLSSIPLVRSNIHYFISTIYIGARDLDKTMQHLELAMQAVPQVETMQVMVTVLLSAGLEEEAGKLMDGYTPNWPNNPWLRKKQQLQWKLLREQLGSNI